MSSSLPPKFDTDHGSNPDSSHHPENPRITVKIPSALGQWTRETNDGSIAPITEPDLNNRLPVPEDPPKTELPRATNIDNLLFSEHLRISENGEESQSSKEKCGLNVASRPSSGGIESSPRSQMVLLPNDDFEENSKCSTSTSPNATGSEKDYLCAIFSAANAREGCRDNGGTQSVADEHTDDLVMGADLDDTDADENVENNDDVDDDVDEVVYERAPPAMIFECSKSSERKKARGRELEGRGRKNEETQTKSLECSVCQRSFRKPQSLRTHFRIKHKPISCEICEISFVDSKQLAKHNGEKHPEIGVYKCAKCDQVSEFRMDVV